ncbi:MAG: lipoprotein insertase outer membrane protein LolB [Coxiella-like endosymbiont]|uniref:lipoprotein insertase outer membrane protein LolB n=1 Tax=Coxiella-like endosymbiont TaxID=1592897 RepID=UPI002810B0CF|nr:lipoprotein insertase outer membrane protein LolB [Coxiella-like endosymbiont]
MKKNNHVLIAFIFFTVTLLINGCRTLRLPSQSTSAHKIQNWQQRYQALSHISIWSINGVFSIQQGGKTVVAYYDWQQKGRNYRIRIHSALDIYSINISGGSSVVLLWRSPKERYIADTPERLMQEQLGWQLPVSNLYYWIRGIHSAGKYLATFDLYCHLITLQQNGWHILFSQYTTIGPVDLPRMLKLNSRKLTVKIVIKNWNCNLLNRCST